MSRTGGIALPLSYGLSCARALQSRTHTGKVILSGTQKYAEAVAGAADLRVGIIQRHRTAWDEIRELERMAFQAALDPDWVPPGDEPVHPLPFGKRIEYATSLARLFKLHSEQLMTAQKSERQANGFDYKLQQSETKPPEDPEIGAKRVQGLRDLIAGIHDMARQKASYPSSSDTGT
jgi:hypothetical protein